MNGLYSILVIDDDQAHAESTAEILQREGYNVHIATSGNDGKEAISKTLFDIIITDLVMSDVDGFEILEHAKKFIEDVQLIIMTGHASVETAVKAMRNGALTYLTKPLNIEELRQVVSRACERIRLTRDNRNLHRQLDEKFGFEGFIGNTPVIRKIFSVIKQVAPTDASVLIYGKSGTGKELIAKSLHNNSLRKQNPFVALNCAALSEGILESELFGHVKGAFTGASSARKGKFEYADGGTLFLDEVGDIPMAVQVKLLRTLESGEFSPVGSNDSRTANVRIIAATNKNLENLVSTNKFREDLYFRLKVVTLQLPTLRERKEDIPLLLNSFIEEFSEKYNKTIHGISQPCREIITNYDWPGNVRELRNAVESMVVVSTGNEICKADLPSPLDVSGPVSHSRIFPAATTMAEMEKRLILETLEQVNGNRHEAARQLDIGERTLYRKLKTYLSE